MAESKPRADVSGQIICFNCKFYVPTNPPQTLTADQVAAVKKGISPHSAGVPYACCQRYPPEARWQPAAGTDVGHPDRAWPFVYALDWCGEFVAAVGARLRT